MPADQEGLGGAEPVALGPGESLAERAYAAIEELIVSSRLAPRSFVSEIQLSTRLGIGRTPVREALKRLEADGLVIIVPSRGIMVTEIDLKRQLLVLEVRRELERLIITRTARLATAAERDGFRRMADEMQHAAQTGDGDTFRRLDHAFNELLDSCCRSPVAQQAIRPLRAQSRRFWFHNYAAQTDSLSEGSRTHTAVMRAIAAEDLDAARVAADVMMDYVESFARATLEMG